MFADLTADGNRSLLPGLPEVRVLPDLRIDGYLDGSKVATKTMSADLSLDRLSLIADPGPAGPGWSRSAPPIPPSAGPRFRSLQASASPVSRTGSDSRPFIKLTGRQRRSWPGTASASSG